MSPLRWRTLPALAALLASVPALRAQQPTPRVGYVYPAGGRQGATFEVTAGGQFLTGVSRALVSGAGVQATVIEHVRPMTVAQFNELREQLRELMEKRPAAAKPQGQGAWTPEDEKKAAEIRQKIASFVRRPASPAIA